ncbi:MAG: ribosome maturation factor RimM [Prevotella sp.]
MVNENDVFRIGRIGKPHGVKGEVSFHFDDDVFDRNDADFLFLRVDGILVPFFLEEYRFHGNETALLKFCDVDTQEQARMLTGSDVFFPRSSGGDDSAPSWAEIVGFVLKDSADGRVVGRVTGVDDSTENILFEVERPDGEELLVPAHGELIADVDVAARTIVMDVPLGLL